MSIVKKEIKDFTLDTNPQGDSQLIIQTIDGITQKTTKTALLNDVNAGLIGLQSQIDNLPTSSNVIHIGTETCNIDQSIYTINFNYTFNVTPIPIVTLTIPNETQIISVLGVYDVTSTSCKVKLSSAPTKLGYSINWLVANNYNITDNTIEDLQYQIDNIDVSNYATTSEVTNISSNLQYQIDNIDLSNYATTSEVTNISSNLQYQIDNIPTSPTISSNNDNFLNGSNGNAIDSGFNGDQIIFPLLSFCPISSNSQPLSGINIEYQDFVGITNHTKSIINDISGFPQTSIEIFDYGIYNYEVTKNYVFSGNIFISNTVSINKVVI